MNEKITRTWLRLMPKRTLSDLAGWASDLRIPRVLLEKVIKSFCRAYGVDLDEIEGDLSSFRSFDEFFMRRLKDGARPVDSDERAIVCPADGQWTCSGKIEALQLTQIKGKRYSAGELLNSEDLADVFKDGVYVTVYLSPHDYHRVHFPCAGKVTGCTYVPGELFPVNPASVRTIDHLFSRNERLIVNMKTEGGPVAVLMIGATCVARISQSFAERPKRFLRGEEVQENYDKPINVKGGDELGVFHMGSTVVMLFERGSVELEGIGEGDLVKTGRRIGKWSHGT